MSRLPYGDAGLLGLWLWEKDFRLPKRHLGARVHSLWVLQLTSKEAKTARHYAGFVVLPGMHTLTLRFKRSLKLSRPRKVLTTNDDVKGLQYLEDPLCGDTGSFPLPLKGDPAEVAKMLERELHQAGHDLAALDPAHFREPHVDSSSGSPR